MRMVGRADELARLRSAWSDVVTGGRVTAVITGDAGTGKSLLVSTALGDLAPRPRVVLAGSARVHSPAPYDWLASVLSAREPVGVPVPPDALAWLAQHPDAPRERYTPDALLRMAVRVVRGLVGTGPAVIVVEDLHALDPASLNLVGELATAPDLPALLLVTSRAADHGLVRHTLSRLSGGVRLHLGPLGATEVAELLAAAHPREPLSLSIVDAVVERTGGNPYRLTELMARSRSVADLDGTAPAELTARETQVLSCLASGMSNKQIARTLGISVRTVTVHVSNLLRKTGSASRTEAALWAVRRSAVNAGSP